MNNKINPFKTLCVSLGNLPTSYIESMSYYECLTYLVNYLDKQVVPSVNNNTEAIKELQDYVTHYFDNLDVQEEINNKLDQMASDGELTEIIAQYLTLAGVLAYSTVADMKSAENLTDGSICKTLGYHSILDGGNGLYKVREITNDDVVDEGSIIALNDPDLVAELIPEGEVNPIQFGAYGDGVHDDLTALENCRDYCTTNAILMTSPKGCVYGVSDGFTLTAHLCLDFKNATIKAITDMSYVVRLHKTITFKVDPVNSDYTQNLVIDCDNRANYGLYEDIIGWSLLVENIKIVNPKQIGIYIDVGQIRLHNVKVEQMEDVNCTGLKVNSTDSEYRNIVTRDCTTGIECNGGSNGFYECHPVMFNRNMLSGSKGFIINANAVFVHPIADTFEYGFYVTNNYGFTLINPQVVINSSFYNDDTMSNNPYFVYFTQDQTDNRILISGANAPGTVIVDSDYLSFTNLTTWNGVSILANNPHIARHHKDGHINGIANEVVASYNTYNLSSNMTADVTGTCLAFTNGALVNYRINITLGSALTDGNSKQFVTSIPDDLTPLYTRYFNTVTNSGSAITIGLMNDNSIRVYARGNDIASDEAIVGEITFIKQ